MFTDVSGSHLHCIIKYTVVSHCDCFPLWPMMLRTFVSYWSFILVYSRVWLNSACLTRFFILHWCRAEPRSLRSTAFCQEKLSPVFSPTWWLAHSVSNWHFPKLKCLVLVKPGAKTFSFHITALELHCSWRKWSYLNWAKHKLDANHSVIWCISKLQCQLDTP